MQNLEYSAVIFDMDGVIFDSEPLHQEVEAEILRNLGIVVDPEDSAAFLGANSYEMWARIIDRHGLTRSVEELVELERRRYRVTATQRGVPLVPGAEDLIRSLAARGTPLAVASSSPELHIEEHLEQAHLKHFFPVRVSGDSVPRSKPDPAIFLRAADLLGVPPEACIVIEDSPNGVAAAAAAGIHCIGLTNKLSGSPDISSADRVCCDLTEVSKLLLAE